MFGGKAPVLFFLDCWLTYPLQTDRPGAAKGDKVKERDPRGLSVGRIPLPSVTKTGSSRHVLLFLQIKPPFPAAHPPISRSEVHPRQNRLALKSIDTYRKTAFYCPFGLWRVPLTPWITDNMGYAMGGRATWKRSRSRGLSTP